MTKKNSQNGQVRIIGGHWRSMRIAIPSIEGLRPTTDRVRETLFNWLTGYIMEARVLDCFGGSGALSFESLSRLAAYARIFELNAVAVEQINNNLCQLGCQQANVIRGDTLELLKTPPNEGFDIIFIDPPFRQGLAEQSIQLLTCHQWFNKNAKIYVETESELDQLKVPSTWTQLKEKKDGQVLSRLYQYQ